MLGILDYEAGNQTSVRRALEHLAIPCTISKDARVLRKCCGLIFPGVGAAGQAMEQLKANGLDLLLHERVAQGIPVLGICLGCQILLEHSEENDTDLLAILKGQCLKFSEQLRDEEGNPAPVPHMGWNTLTKHVASPLLAHIDDHSFFYFVHSYYVRPDPRLVIATTTYGVPFCSVYGRDGLWGVQFHPEKSGRPGLTLLENFYTYSLHANRTKHHAE